MNKRSRKRAALVYAILCLLYVAVIFRLPEKMSMSRITGEQSVPSKSAFLPVPDADAGTNRNAPPSQGALSPTTASSTPAGTDAAAQGQGVEKTQVPLTDGPSADTGRAGIEPSFLIAVPVVCYAIKQGWMEKEGLIFDKKDAYNNVIWKKPLDILRDRDEDGVRSILNTIGQKRVLEFVKQEGINASPGLSAEDIILGKGYRVSSEKLVALYNRYVGTECNELFPFR